MTFAWWHIAVALVPMLPAFWSIWDIWSHAFNPPERKMLWLVLVVFIPVIGALIYIVYGRKQAVKNK